MPPIDSLRRVNALDVRLSSVKMRTSPWGCVDGSLSSACLSNQGVGNWLSVQVPARQGDSRVSVAFVGVIVHCPWQGMGLAPFEIWISRRAFGATGTQNGAVACSELPIEAEPKNAEPLFISCAGHAPLLAPDSPAGEAESLYVTLLQLGAARGVYVSELLVYERVSPAAHPPGSLGVPILAAPTASPAAAKAARASMVTELNHRFINGGPSRSARSAGVLVHMLDEFEQDAKPWHLSRQCEPFKVDHLACSLIYKANPTLFPGGRTLGLVLSADADILCVYAEDRGSGGSVNGGCPYDWWKSDGSALEEVLRSQRYLKYNEVIVNGISYETHLPAIVQGIFYTTFSYWKDVLGLHELRRDEELSAARELHRAFILENYGLDALAMGLGPPLLRFDGHRFVEVT